MPLILFSSRKKSSSAVITPLSYDQYWNNVALLMHMDGTSGSAYATDVLGTAIVSKNVVLSGEKYISGSTSLKFTGASQQAIRIDNLTICDFSNGADFTVEGQFYPLTAIGTNQMCLFNSSGIAGLSWQSLELQYTNNEIRFRASSANAGTDIADNLSIGSPVLNSWNHYAVVRQGGVYKLFLNGELKLTITGKGAPYKPTYGFYIGAYQVISIGNHPIVGLNGYVDEVRITKGIARYTSNFSAPTEAFPNKGISLDYDPYWDSVALLMPLNNTITDTKNHVVVNNNVAMDRIEGFRDGYGYAPYWGGLVNTYLEIAPTSQLVLTADYTIEAWFKITGASPDGAHTLIGDWVTGASSDWGLFVYDSGHVYFYFTGNNAITTASPIVVAQKWTHIACVKNGNTVTLYIDGVSKGTATSTNTLGSTSNPIWVGRQHVYGNRFKGYMNNIRISKMARYTSNFSVPTASFLTHG
jgi:hypothetical protein